MSVIKNPPTFSAKENWLLDGGLATELEKKGADLKHFLWSARILKDNPEMIFDTHLEYMHAGADIITTASYQASLDGFMKYGMYLREARETIFSSVMLACLAREKYYSDSAVTRPILLAASCGPYGAYLADQSEYTGAYMPVAENKLREYFEPKIEALLSPRKNFFVDFLLLETMPSMGEVQFVLRLLKRYPSARCVVSFSVVDEALKSCEMLEKDPQVLAWGLNCLGTGELTEGLKRICEDRARNGSSEIKPLWAAPNGSNSSMDWTEMISQWNQLGVRIHGGCCHTRPADTQQINQILSPENL